MPPDEVERGRAEDETVRANVERALGTWLVGAETRLFPDAPPRKYA